MVGNDYDDLKLEYIKLKQQLDTFMQIMPRMGYGGAPLESKEIVTKLDEIKEILSAAAVEEGGASEDPLVDRLEKLINLLESSMVVEGNEAEEDKLMESLSKVAATMEKVAESIRMNTEKLQEMEKTFKTIEQTYAKQEPPKKYQYEPEEKFERKITEEAKKQTYGPSTLEKHEKILDEALEEFSESDFLKKVNQVLPEERVETIFSKKPITPKIEDELMDSEPSMEEILREAQELGIDTKGLMKEMKGGTKTKTSGGSIFAPITLYVLGIFWLVFSIFFLFNNMGILPLNNPISGIFNLLKTGFMGLAFYIVMMVTGLPAIIFGIKAKTVAGTKGSDNAILLIVGLLWIVAGAMFLLFKGNLGLPLPNLGIMIDLILALILIFSSALAIVMGTEFSRKKIMV